MRLPVHKYLAIAFSFLLLPFFQPAIAHAGADDNQDLHKIEEILARFAKIYKGKPTGGCWWEPTRGTTEDETELFQFLKRLDGGVLQNHAIHTTSSQLQYTNLETGKTKGLNIRQCWGDQANSPQVGDKLYDEVGPPNPSVLLPSLYDRAVGTIYDPVPDMSPTTDMYINLGLWMAVEPLDPHPLVVRAEIPGAWAQVTATAISTTFDMGNGDTVVCNKHHGGVFGTPIPVTTSATKPSPSPPPGRSKKKPASASTDAAPTSPSPPNTPSASGKSPPAAATSKPNHHRMAAGRLCYRYAEHRLSLPLPEP